ncbi:MAG: thioesterase [Bacteroidetes bacterium 4572_117]|nr:MAG: thioesterase [Bacteroidetes bacterium 4572_117]
MLKKLPLAFLTGLKIIHIDENMASVSIPFKYLNQNPFQSIYFAALAMAAELSTGIMAMISVQSASKPVSMLVFNMSASFMKKARGKIVFSCYEGKAIEGAIEESIKTGEGKTVTVTSKGVDNEGDEVADFKFTWTFKPKS